LRAFTANDRKAIKMTAQNYPLSEFYQTDELITSLGIGEALVTALNEKGVPTPLAATMMRSPMSRMDVLTQSEIDQIISNSKLVRKYNEVVDRDSAYEMLTRKIDQAEQQATIEKQRTQKTTAKKSSEPMSQTTKSVVKVLTSATFIRGAFGVLSKLLKGK